MKPVLLTLCFFFCLCLVTKQTHASHGMGADLTYTCLGGNNYKLRLSFYRDCYGIAADLQASIIISSVSCGQNFTVLLDAIPGTGQEITPICPSASSTCNGGTFTGIEEWIYEGTVTLPAQCTDWEFSYDLCCRNAAITTISGPDLEDIYIHSYLNNTIAPCNNSPTFSNKPVPFVCLDQEFCFNHGAYDVDGDSLAYSLITPLSISGLPVTYFNPYTATQPLNSVPPMSFDPLTGDFCATPQQIEVTVMAVLVKEYRNGVLIGQVERDMQITVIPCTNTLPGLTGIDGTGNFTATICADEPFCFDIFSNDADTGQTVSMSWDTSIIAGTFNANGTPYPTGTFCWTPTQSDVSATAHCFTVRVWDDNCPYFGSQVYSYCLTVVNLTVDAGPDQSVGCSSTATITAVAGGTPGTYTYQWSNGSTSASQSVGVGTYTVTVSNGLCTATDVASINPLSGPAAAFSSNAGCSTLAGFTDQTTISNGNITGWSWNFGDGNSSAQQNPAHQYAAGGTYNVCLIVSSSVGCTDTVCQDVTVSEPPVAGFNTNNACEGDAITVNNTTAPAGSISSYNWDFGNGSTSVLQNPAILYSGAATYTITLIATDTAGCADTIQQQVTVYPLPVPAFTINYDPCLLDQVSFTDNSGGNITSWNWNFGDGQTSNQQNPNIVYSATGTYNITLIVTTADGCTDSISQTQDIIPPIVVTPGPSQSICDGQQANISASGGISYQWSDGQSGSVISVSPNATTTYIVTVTDANGCSDTTSVLVTVFPLPQLVPGPDPALCNGQSTILTISGATNYVWSTGETTASITVAPATSTAYSVTGTDNNGCSATASVNVTVNDPPVANLQDISFCSGASGVLDVGLTGMSYLWNDGQTGQSISVTQSGSYTVTVTDANGCLDTAQAMVTVNSLPQLNTSPDQVICDGETISLSVSGANNYLWSTGAITSAINVSPSANTIYSVTGTDLNGCEASATINVVVNSLPVVSIADVSICPGNSTLLDAGLSGMSYLWNTGQTTQDISVSQAGSYTVTVTDGNGCSASDQASLTVFAQPQVSAGTDQDICKGESITLSATGGVSYVWNTGDTSSGIIVSPLINTSYSVIGTNANGCMDTAYVNVDVHNLPFLNLPNSLVCPGSTTTLNAMHPGMTFLWSTGQTTQTIIVSQPGFYTITITNSWGCSASQTIQVTPGGGISNNTNTVSFCMGDSAVLDAGNPGNTYLWIPGGETTQVITVSSAGQYSVVITNPNGCSGTVNSSVNVNPLPAPGFTANGGCAGQPVNFADTTSLSAGTISQWLWDFGDGNSSLQQNPVHAYGSSGNFLVTLTVTSDSGCTASFSQAINTAALPVANFSSSGACPETPVQFTDGSAGGNITSWSWNFGDGNTSLVQNPSHSYALPGTYSVTLTATTSNGCSDSKIKQVVIHNLPDADFSATTVCQGLNTLFTDLSSDSTGTINSWSWNLGDSTASSQSNPSHVYSQSGSFTTQLVVTSSNGCLDTVTHNVYVNALPVANAGPDQAICQGQPVTLTASGGISYLWSTGQTVTSISVNPAATTTYIVTVTNNNGCVNTDAVVVGVGSVPVVNVPDVFICTGNSAVLNAGNPGSSYSWSTGETTQSISVSAAGNYLVIVTNSAGCTAVAQASVTVGGSGLTDNLNDLDLCPAQSAVLNAGNPGNSFLWSTGATTQTINVNAAGNYTVTVTDTSGCAASFTAALTINPVPVAGFSATTSCLNDQTAFTNTSSISSGNIAGYLWNFGDGTTSQLQNPVHTYTATGNYNVRLTVTSDMGCIDSITTPAHVFATPTASFTAPNVCLYNSVSFTDNSSVSNDSINSWSWNFGDNTTGANQNVFHQYANPGTYPVILVVTTVNGCIDSSTHNIIVHPVPQAGFSASPVCENAPVIFSDTSSVNTGTITSWNWNFGDGTTGSIQNPSHNYPAYGTYTASLIVTSNYGCTDTVMHNIAVFPIPAANYTTNNVCLGNATVFNNQSSVPYGTITSAWNFGDGTITSIQNPSHTYQSAGTFNTLLTVTTNNGCIAAISHSVTVYNLPVAQFTTNDVCLGQPAIFTDQSSSASGAIISRSWDFGDGTTDTVLNPLHTYSNFGIYPVTLEVTSGFGCTAIYIDTITIFMLPQPVISVNNGCITDPVTFTDISDTSLTGTVAWLWDFGDGNTSANPNTVHTYQAPGTYTITLTSFTANGCEATATVQLEIYPVPDAGFSNGNACAGNAVQFTNTSVISSGTIAGYQWFFGDSTVSTEINPSHVYIHTGVYSVMLIATSNFGCTDTVWGHVVIFANPVTSFVFDQAAGCGPLIIHFTDSSYVAGSFIVSWDWNFGDGNSDTVQNPVHVYATSGNYSVTLNTVSADGCKGSFTIDNAIEIYPDPVAAFIPDPYVTTILQPVHFVNHSIGATAYLWNFGDGAYSDLINPKHLYNDTGNYVIYLIAINQYECRDTAIDEVIMTPTFTAYIPNAFSPNNDGMNEIFTISGIGIKNYEMSVWNRWGDLVYNGINCGWNGKMYNSGKYVKEDVYVYQVVFRDIFNELHKRFGRVTLIK